MSRLRNALSKSAKARSLQGIVDGGEAAAGDRRDHVDLVEQRAALALPDDRGRAQRLEDAVGERGRPGAAAGEGEHDEQAVGVVRVAEIGEAIAGPGLVVRKRRVEREPAQPPAATSAASASARRQRAIRQPSWRVRSAA